VRRIVSSQGFAGSSRLSEFLSYIVEEQIAGRGEAIKEYVIGVEVYRKPKDYDPRVNAAVRVDAGKLWARLERYYENDGREDPVRIAVPKGGYVPSFEIVVPPVTPREVPAAEARPGHRGLILAATGACVLLVAGGVVAFRPRSTSQPDVRTWMAARSSTAMPSRWNRSSYCWKDNYFGEPQPRRNSMITASSAIVF
jgi:hypothetical protein